MADGCKYKTSVGGQAVMEGIMMRGPAKWCLAVRTPDGEGTVLAANVVAGTLKVRSNVESLAPKIYKRSECTYLRGGRRAPVEPDPDHT